ncbi:hypothetical protein [Streptomyces niveus]|uniref:hypothetical protein n=1 Tax=Streptomyces niveus TaxID=193462 RepID=UPI00342CD3C1
MIPTREPAETFPCAETAWYEVRPASVAAAAWSNGTPSGSATTSRSSTTTSSANPPFFDVPGPSMAAGTTTFWPTVNRVTPDPTAETVPAIS